MPFPPGGANDIVARIVNVKLPGLLGQNLIIDNRAGAGGNLGAEIAAKSPPDGYTLLIANNALTANFSLYQQDCHTTRSGISCRSRWVRLRRTWSWSIRRCRRAA